MCGFVNKGGAKQPLPPTSIGHNSKSHPFTLSTSSFPDNCCLHTRGFYLFTYSRAPWPRLQGTRPFITLILKRYLSAERLCESLVTSPSRRFSRDRTKVPRAKTGQWLLRSHPSSAQKPDWNFFHRDAALSERFTMDWGGAGACEGGDRKRLQSCPLIADGANAAELLCSNIKAGVNFLPCWR